MTPRTNRVTRSAYEARRSLTDRREPKAESDSDSLMSGVSDDNDDDDGDDDDGEQGANVNRRRNSHIFSGELKMPPYEHAKRQLSQLLELMNGPYLDLAPHYQRGVVWSRKAMRHLIDSMWRGYYIPPVIFNMEIVQDENGAMRFKRTCVDGKQRLTSIRDFMNGHFACRINKKPWYFCLPPNVNTQGPKKKILPEAAKEEFRSIEILCTEYKGLTERQEIELFQRVQLGKPLSQAEAFRATQGSWQDFAKLYERDFENVVNLVKQARASGFRQVLSCFMQIFECIDPTGADGIPRFKNSIKSIETFCSSAVLDLDTKQHLRFVFALFHDLVEEDRSTFENNGYTRIKTFSPIELVGVCCLLSQKGAERPNGMLRGDILAMRTHLRELHSDLRMNKECWLSIWRFIDQLENYRGAVDGSTVRKAPAKAIKRKPRPTQAEIDSFVEDERLMPGITNPSSVPGNVSQKPPVASMTRKNPRPNPDVTASKADLNAGSGSLLMQLSAAASSRRAPGGDLNAALTATRSIVSPSITPSMTPVSNPGQRDGQGRQHSWLSVVTSDTGRTSHERVSSRDITTSNPSTTLTPLNPSPISTESISGHPNALATMPRKRAALDLGPSVDGNKELESKRARLVAGFVKQEKES